MSDKGSFVTEIIDCDECLKTLESALLGGDKYLFGVRLPSWTEGAPLRIIAGTVAHLGGGMEWLTLTESLYSVRLCHAVTILVICENGRVERIVAGPGENLDNERLWPNPAPSPSP